MAARSPAGRSLIPITLAMDSKAVICFSTSFLASASLASYPFFKPSITVCTYILLSAESEVDLALIAEQSGSSVRCPEVRISCNESSARILCCNLETVSSSCASSAPISEIMIGKPESSMVCPPNPAGIPPPSHTHKSTTLPKCGILASASVSISRSIREPKINAALIPSKPGSTATRWRSACTRSDSCRPSTATSRLPPSPISRAVTSPIRPPTSTCP